MSAVTNDQRMPYAQALAIAEQVVADISPYCQRIEIAGSLRRKRETIGDIEIVCVPKIRDLTDLFGEDVGLVTELDDVKLYRLGYGIPKGGDKYKRLELPKINVDLFITMPERWGWIFAIRTGSADFSHWLVSSKQIGGALPSNMRVKDGLLWMGKTVIETPEEVDVFRVIGLTWIPPEQRIEGKWRF